ncbi:MAG: ketoacyl-ACP synthase III [bacterium]|nr:ketoacyl-ACP synthase III [bacterium]
MSVGITGTGKYLPEKVVTNEDIVNMGLDTSTEWIEERTGIKERRVAEENISSSDMAFEAAEDALKDAGLDSEDIDLLIVSTTTPDYQVFPSTACLLQDRLGLRNVGAFDLSAACTGFSYALTTGAQFVKSGDMKNVLVVSVDCLSRFVDWTDRSICILFGDGAGAVVLSEVDKDYGILLSELYSQGDAADLLMVPAGGSRRMMSMDILEQKENLVRMDGRAVFKMAVNSFVPSVLNAVKKAGLSLDDINYFVPHQANLRIIDLAAQKLKLDKNKVLINIQKYGNTSSASIPIIMAEAKREGLFKDGDIIVMAGFGAGFTWAVNILRWGGINV